MTACIEWTGARTSSGYGHRTIKGRQFQVHRLAWEAANGPIPDGMCVLHRCDNRPCFNIEHLFLGTRLDNNLDAIAKGRARRNPRRGESHAQAKFTDAQAEEIRTLYAAGGVTYQSLADAFGCSLTHVTCIVLRQRRFSLNASSNH